MYEEHDTDSSKYLILTEPIGVLNENFDKLYARTDSVIVKDIMPSAEELSTQTACDFEGNSLPYLSLIDSATMLAQENTIREEMPGLF